MSVVLAAGLAAVGCAVLLVLVVALGGGRMGATGAPGVVCAPPGVDPAHAVPGFDAIQMANARLIVVAGVEMRVPQEGIVIAVATAMQESELRIYANPTVPESMTIPHQAVGSDHDSVGLFQQREAGWGTVAARMDPKASAHLFYEKLLQVPDWQTLPLAEAAQAVQVSAIPDAYSRWAQPASTIVGALQAIACSPTGQNGNPPPADPRIQRVISRAMTQQGQPYVWGGGDARGPTQGGFDCSGLMVYAFAELNITVPHQTQAIWTTFQPAITDVAQLAPGDMLLFSDNGQPGGIHHVGLYLGNGKMLHAPETGEVVTVVDDLWNKPYWSQQFIGGVRAVGATSPPPSA